ncbi:YciI family protein [Candidatus Binatia bacterium]|nr:YciI family protein [Candidatus Binatia bacterium]
MLFVIIGHDAPDARDKRPRHRPAHLAHLEPLTASGKLLLAGPFTDGGGSLIVIDAESAAAVWDLLSRDPYVTNGVFNRVEVRPFLQVFPRADA